MAGDQDAPPPMTMPAAGSADAAVVEWVGGLLEDRGRAALAAPGAGGGGGGGGGGFRLDPERAQVAVQTLTGIVDDLEAAQRRWRMPAAAGGIGTDPVSVQLGLNVIEMNRRATAYVHAWANQLRETRDALQAQLDGYVVTEQGNAERLG